MKRAKRASLGSWKAPSGRPEPVSSPAPARDAGTAAEVLTRHLTRTAAALTE